MNEVIDATIQSNIFNKIDRLPEVKFIKNSNKFKCMQNE